MVILSLFEELFMASVPDSLLRDWSLSESIERYGWNRRSTSFVEVKGHTYVKLRDQLLVAEQELQLKGDEQKKLESVRDQLETEVDELTASLFENANKMVIDANVRRMDAERKLESTQTKVVELQTEIQALKTLFASYSQKGASDTPLKKSSTPPTRRFSLTKKGFRRSKSHHQMTDLLPPETETAAEGSPTAARPRLLEDVEGLEEFREWKKTSELAESSPFVKKLVEQDVRPCLGFDNAQVTEALVADIISNRLSVEALPPSDHQTRFCGLTHKEVMCSFCVKFSTTAQPLFVSQDVRDKIIAVCDLFLYLSYIKLKLIRSHSDRELFEQIQLLRRNVVLRRLGFPVSDC